MMRITFHAVTIMNLFFMLMVSIILFVDDNLFKNEDSNIYSFMLQVAPQAYHGTAAFFIAVILFTGMILNKKSIEACGLFLSGVFLLVVLSSFLTTFPNIGSAAFAVWTMASFMQIVNLIHENHEEKERFNNDTKN